MASNLACRDGRNITPPQGVAHSSPDGDSIQPELLTLKQVAALCGASERTVWGWARSGVSPAPIPLGKGTVRYSRQAYIAWIAAGCPRVDGGQDHE